jgi:hypothetical protein
VITLNYDTLIEQVASSVSWKARSTPIPTGQLYSIPFTPAVQRGSALIGYPSVDTFKLLKLHGSINWLYSGRSDFFGEEIFYVPCVDGVDGVFIADEEAGNNRTGWSKMGDKTALIIPPTLDKSEFFQHESLRSMWYQAGRALSRADRIICMGYSLPASDLTMAHFLKNSLPSAQAPFVLVNIAVQGPHFSAILGADSFDFTQTVPENDCVARFVVDNCIPKQEDKTYVINMTHWTKTS